MREFILKKLIHTKSISKSTYFWSAFSAALNSFQTTVLLLFITRSDNITDSSIFVISYAVGNLLLTVGKFGIRNYQVTDQQKVYTDQEYVDSRKITVLIMIVAALIYIGYGVIFNNYDIYKALCMICICGFKVIDAYEDVYHGKLQQDGRLDIASKVLSIRYIALYITFIICYVITNNLLISSFCCLLVIFSLFLFLNFNILKDFFKKTTCDKYRIKKMLIEIFPLAVTSILIMYLGNAPKYLIDEIVSDELQTNFNIVFMPVFVIALFGTFIFNPLIKKLSELWQEGNLNRFNIIIFKLIGIIGIITVGVIILGDLIGLKILSFIYGVDVNDWTLIFTLLLLSGGFLAIFNLMNIVYTIFRKQKLLLYIFVIGVLVFLIFGNYVLEHFDLLGVCVLFCFILGLVLGLLLIFMILTMKKNDGA